MAGIGRNSSEPKKATIDELKADFKRETDEIRKILEKTKDRADLKEADRHALRALYSKAARTAKTLSERVTNDEEATKFKEFFKKLSDAAATYGSVMRNKVPETTFDDVKGLDEVKNLVKSFIFMANNTHLVDYYKLKGGLGMLMYGAPGTGKTMFAEAIANAMGLPLFIVTPADIFKSYVGESEQAVKQIFLEIDACTDGAILFVDECESIFSRRKEDTKDYKSAVTTELLQRMNGFGVNGAKRIMIAATNRPDQIDPAYLRYKRFSHIVHIPPPDREAKRAIIEGKLKNIALASDVTIDDILRMTEKTVVSNSRLGAIEEVGALYSAADLCGIIEEACRIALERIEAAKSSNAIPLTRDMFEKAFSKIPASISRQSLALYENFLKN